MGKKIENIIGQLSIFDILGISESIEGFSSDDFGKAISKLQKAQRAIPPYNSALLIFQCFSLIYCIGLKVIYLRKEQTTTLML